MEFFFFVLVLSERKNKIKCNKNCQKKKKCLMHSIQRAVGVVYWCEILRIGSYNNEVGVKMSIAL